MFVDKNDENEIPPKSPLIVMGDNEGPVQGYQSSSTSSGWDAWSCSAPRLEGDARRKIPDQPRSILSWRLLESLHCGS